MRTSAHGEMTLLLAEAFELFDELPVPLPRCRLQVSRLSELATYRYLGCQNLLYLMIARIISYATQLNIM
jgi:hypothetical protein